jgi:hypothetical protein
MHAAVDERERQKREMIRNFLDCTLKFSLHTPHCITHTGDDNIHVEGNLRSVCVFVPEERVR